MKHILITSTLIIAAVVAAPQPQEKVDPIQAAQLAVHHQLVAKLRPTHRPFSRAAPRGPSAFFRPTMIVKGEERMPFTIGDERSKSVKPLTGYVRLSDQKIFLLDAKTGKHQLASKDPRFAPPKDSSVASRPRS